MANDRADAGANERDSVHPSSAEESERLWNLLRERTLSIPELRRVWEGRNRGYWAGNPGLFSLLAEDLRRRAEFFWSYDVAAEGLLSGGDPVRLKQLQALALADTGSFRAAEEVLSGLLKDAGPDSETLSLLGRTHKDLMRHARNPAERETHLARARECYRKAFDDFGGYYPGINAASLAHLGGDQAEARALARRVEEVCRREGASGDDVWRLATMGEAALLLGRWELAEENYRRAVTRATDAHSVVSSMRRQARLLSGDLDSEKRTALLELFELPPIIVFTGHRIDAPDRPVPRFPESAAERVKTRLRVHLDQVGSRIGVSSAAAGGDILFLEAMLERGGEIHVVLPMPPEAFCRTSVSPDPGSPWVAQFHRVLERAASVTFASAHNEPGGSLVYRYTNDLILGLALDRGRALGSEVTGLALWNGGPGGGSGGTADAVARWVAQGRSVDVIDPIEPHLAVRQAGAADLPLPPRAEGNPDAVAAAGTGEASAAGQEIKAMLFADVVGFSKLTEEELPLYIRHFLGAVGELLEGLPVKSRAQNTWGDAIHAVFDDVLDAGHLALALRDLMESTDWSGLGFGNPLSIRIGLHAGVVFPFFDPVTRRQNYCGYHVNRAARIEPIADEGQIFASEPFVALAALRAGSGLRFEYAGRRPLAKRFGSDRLFVLRGGRG